MILKQKRVYIYICIYIYIYIPNSDQICGERGAHPTQSCCTPQVIPPSAQQLPCESDILLHPPSAPVA